MDFTGLKIPNGIVTKIRDSNGNLLWRKEELSVKVNAVTTKNIIDSTITGNFINKEGVITENVAWQVSDYLPCEPGNVEVASTGTSPGICFYDKDKNFISGVPYLNTNPKAVIAPPKTYYCRWSVSNNANVSTYVVIPFSNYTELFKSSMITKVINLQGEVVSDYVSGSSTFTGEVNGIGIPCDGKTTVNFNGFGITAGRLLTCFYDADDKPISGTRTKPNATSGSISIPDGACYVRFSYYFSVGTSALPNAFKNFTINME